MPRMVTVTKIDQPELVGGNGLESREIDWDDVKTYRPYDQGPAIIITMNNGEEMAIHHTLGEIDAMLAELEKSRDETIDKVTAETVDILDLMYDLVSMLSYAVDWSVLSDRAHDEFRETLADVRDRIQELK